MKMETVISSKEKGKVKSLHLKEGDSVEKDDLVICLDAECGSYDRLWLTTSLRGMLLGTLEARVLTEGVHSGAASGIVPSSFRVLRALLERVEDTATGALAEPLHVAIAAEIETQARDVTETLGADVTERFPWAASTGPIPRTPSNWYSTTPGARP
jgi:hypothetical protein